MDKAAVGMGDECGNVGEDRDGTADRDEDGDVYNQHHQLSSSCT